MSQATHHGKSIEALKAFNNAIVMSRLYPPEAPQLANAVERGYKGIREFIRLFGNLSFSFSDEQLMLAGYPLDEETLASFANLVIYRQLRALNVPQLVLSNEMDRFAYTQLIYLFNASVAKIKQEGGGLEYITSLGLASYFPDKESAEPQPPVLQTKEESIQEKKLIIIRPELVETLFDDIPKQHLLAELQQSCSTVSGVVDLLAAGISHVLRSMRNANKIVAAPRFVMMLGRIAKMVDEEMKPKVVSELVQLLAVNLKDTALAVLFCQNFMGAFGGEVYGGLIDHLSLERLGNIINILRGLAASQEKNIDAGSTNQVQEALAQLVATNRGKQFVGMEKARSLLAGGEKERKKKRLEAGLQGLINGNPTSLQSDELIGYLPVAIDKLIADRGDEAVGAICQTIASAVREKQQHTDPFWLSLVRIIKQLQDRNGWDDLQCLVEAIISSVGRDTEPGPGLEAILEKLIQTMQLSWAAKREALGDAVLSWFYRVRTGKIVVKEDIKLLLGKIQDKGIRRASLPDLLAVTLANPKDEKLTYRLVLQGPVALRYLVDSLISTENRDHRLKIIDMLTSSRRFVASVALERLPEFMPWYGKRNLIKLIGETGSEEACQQLMQYLQHEDFRVQREALVSLYRLSKGNRKKVLLDALENSSEKIKIEVIGALGNVADQDVAQKLCEMLANPDQVGEENRSEFLLQLLDSLEECVFPIALKGVQAFLHTRGPATKKQSEQVWKRAEKVQKSLESNLQQARKNHVMAGQIRKNAMKQAALLSRTDKTQRMITGLPAEQGIRTMLAHGDTANAVNKLIEFIEFVAKTKNFTRADLLKEWLVQIDPKGISAILRASEIIEREKTAAISRDHLEIWGRLYDLLSTEEFNLIYYSLRHKQYVGNESIIEQGELQNGLYFINNGQIRIFCSDRDGEKQLKSMGRGEIFGGESFFEMTVSTVSAVSTGISEISILNLDKLQKWRDEYPDLDAKLYNFCKQFDNIDELIKENASERRIYERYVVSGELGGELVDDRSNDIGVTVSGELVNISEGGLSYTVHIPQKESGRMLLGRRIRLRLPLEGDGDSTFAVVVGSIIAVKNIDRFDNQYSLHVRFGEVLSRSQLQGVVTSLRGRLEDVQ